MLGRLFNLIQTSVLHSRCLGIHVHILKSITEQNQDMPVKYLDIHFDRRLI